MLDLTYQKNVAKILLEVGAIGFTPDKLITFKSGIRAPVYVDNRRLPFYPKEWKKVLEGFKTLIQNEKIEFDVIAGVESGGIPHSAALGSLLEKPSVFVRKQSKDYGRKKMVEGGEVKKKRVLLVEDIVTTGSSSLASVEALRNEGATVEDCLIVESYGFKEANDAFHAMGVTLRPLTTFPVILEEAVSLGVISRDIAILVKEWLSDPHHWAEKRGL